MRCFQSWIVRCSPCPLKFSHSNNINKEVKQIWASDTSFFVCKSFFNFHVFCFYIYGIQEFHYKRCCLHMPEGEDAKTPTLLSAAGYFQLLRDAHSLTSSFSLYIVKLVHRGVPRVMYSIVEQALRSGLWMSTWGHFLSWL